MSGFPSGVEPIVLSRAEGVEVLRRGSRAIAIGPRGTWMVLDPAEQRWLAALERPRRLDPRRAVESRALFEAGLVRWNARLHPPPPRVPRSSPPTVSVDALGGWSAGAVLVALDPDHPLEPLIEAARRGVTAIPSVTVGRPEQFLSVFERLRGAGFRAIRLRPGPVESDDEALALAAGLLALAARPDPRVCLSGLDEWLEGSARSERPWGRCAACPVRALCPSAVTPGTPQCAYARRVIEGLLWIRAEDQTGISAQTMG
jgi:hypothetical protein